MVARSLPPLQGRRGRDLANRGHPRSRGFLQTEHDAPAPFGRIAVAAASQRDNPLDPGRQAASGGQWLIEVRKLEMRVRVDKPR